MRTVHETEALRPSDPIPRSHSQAQIKPQRLKLIVNAKPPDREETNGEATEFDDSATLYSNPDLGREAPSVPIFEYPPDIQFTDEELAMPPYELFRLLRRQVHWSEKETLELKEETEALENKRKEEWQAKELVLANLMEAELATAMEAKQDLTTILKLTDQLLPKSILPIGGDQTPWYRVSRTE